MKYGRGPFTFIKRHEISVTASLGEVAVLSSQALWPTEYSAMAHIWAMAYRLKTSGLVV